MPAKRAKTARATGSSAKTATKAKSAAVKKAVKKTVKKTVAASKTAAGKTSVRKTAVRKTPATKTAPKKRAGTVARKTKAAAKPNLLQVVQDALADIKAVNVTVLDVRKLTDIADTLIVASGNSDRHVRAIADRVVEFAKKAGFRPMGVEGERDGEWVLVDLQDVIVHVMLPRVREFYRLESLWDIHAARREAASDA